MTLRFVRKGQCDVLLHRERELKVKLIFVVNRLRSSMYFNTYLCFSDDMTYNLIEV